MWLFIFHFLGPIARGKLLNDTLTADLTRLMMRRAIWKLQISASKLFNALGRDKKIIEFPCPLTVEKPAALYIYATICFEPFNLHGWGWEWV